MWQSFYLCKVHFCCAIGRGCKSLGPVCTCSWKQKSLWPGTSLLEMSLFWPMYTTKALLIAGLQERGPYMQHQNSASQHLAILLQKWNAQSNHINPKFRLFFWLLLLVDPCQRDERLLGLLAMVSYGSNFTIRTDEVLNFAHRPREAHIVEVEHVLHAVEVAQGLLPDLVLDSTQGLKSVLWPSRFKINLSDGKCLLWQKGKNVLQK